MHKQIVNGLALGDHVLRHHVKPRVRVNFAPGRHDVNTTQRPVTHVDNAAGHHAWVVLRLLVEHVLGEPLVGCHALFNVMPSKVPSRTERARVALACAWMLHLKLRKTATSQGCRYDALRGGMKHSTT